MNTPARQTCQTPRTLALLLLPLTAAGCGFVQDILDPLPAARTSPPPYAFKDSNSFGWTMWWDMSQDWLGRTIDARTREGYRPHDLEVYLDEGAVRYACVFLKDPRAWAARYGYTRAEFDRHFNRLHKKGYQLIDIEVVNDDGTLRYSGIWIENPGGPGWWARYDLRQGEFMDDLESWRRKGYRPIDLEVYGAANRTRYAYVVVHDPARSGWEARWGKDADDMDAELRSFVRRGYDVLDFEPSYPQGKLRMSAIFVKGDGRSGYRWTWSRSTGQIQDEIRNVGRTHRPAHVAVGPHEEGGLLYHLIWRRN